MKLRISIIFIICIFMCSCGVEKNSVKNTLKPTNEIERQLRPLVLRKDQRENWILIGKTLRPLIQ